MLGSLWMLMSYFLGGSAVRLAAAALLMRLCARRFRTWAVRG
jgi:hypothetical protein